MYMTITAEMESILRTLRETQTMDDERVGDPRALLRLLHLGLIESWPNADDPDAGPLYGITPNGLDWLQERDRTLIGLRLQEHEFVRCSESWRAMIQAVGRLRSIYGEPIYLRLEQPAYDKCRLIRVVHIMCDTPYGAQDLRQWTIINSRGSWYTADTCERVAGHLMDLRKFYKRTLTDR